MRTLSVLATLTLAFAAAALSAAEPTAASLADAAGAAAWAKVQRFRFTWTYLPGGLVRSYDWAVPAGTVVCTVAGKSVTLPAAGGAALSASDKESHAAFINDSYWPLFPLHLVWDQGVTVANAGEQPVPGMPALGVLPMVTATWPAAGGYTPGDRYDLWLDQDARPLAWAFHKGGVEAPTLVTSRDSYQTVGGLTLATRFVKDDGTPFITISDLAVE